MQYRNELLDSWVGRAVFVRRMYGPAEVSDEQTDQMAGQPGYAIVEPPQALMGFYELVGYDTLGVTLRLLDQGAPFVFVPWGAVLEVSWGAEIQDEGSAEEAPSS
jgi:hypothetical protein